MEIIVGVPLLALFVPLCLVIALRNTRWWWLPGVATFVAGVVMIVIVKLTTTPDHGGPPMITTAGLVAVLAILLLIWGVICLLIGLWASRARRPRPPPAYVVNRRT